MKLVNRNIGIKLASTPEVIEFLKQQQADFITLQEAARPLDSSVAEPYRSQSKIVTALKSDLPYELFGPTWVANAIKTPAEVSYDFGGHIEQGLQLLSRWPIAKGSNEFYHRHYEYMQDWSNWKQEDHGRAVLVSQINIHGQPLQVLNLHGIWSADKLGDERTLAQCQYIVEAAKRSDIPTIIAGDFNLMPHTKSIALMNKHFRNVTLEFNATATTPRFKDAIDTGGTLIDYIFVNDRVVVKDFRVEETDISDHYPLILEFEPV